MFSYHCKALFSGFRQFQGNFVDDQNNLKYRDGVPLSIPFNMQILQILAPLKYFSGFENI